MVDITFLSRYKSFVLWLKPLPAQTTVYDLDVKICQLSPVADEEQVIDPGEQTTAQEAGGFLGRSPATAVDEPSSLTATFECKDPNLDK